MTAQAKISWLPLSSSMAMTTIKATNIGEEVGKEIDQQTIEAIHA
ncbi:MAG: hypothetical protein R3A44_39175 [Caldilineaceae bacterium]